MPRMLAIVAATLLLPAAATAQVYMNVRNCGPTHVYAGPLVPSNPVYVPATYISAGETGRIRCDAAACWIQITYYPATGAVIGTYRHPYTTDRCTRGTEDIAVGDLPDVNNCGC